MASSPLSRRSFLAGLGAVGLLAACGGGSTSPSGASRRAPSGWQGLRISSDLYATDQPQRFAFAVTHDDQFASGPPATARFRPPKGSPGPSVDTTLHGDGLPAGRGVYVAHPVLATAGIWDAVVEIDGDEVDLAFEVAPAAVTPTVGSAAPRAPSPTFDDPLGVDPICTRDGGPCPLHDTSLADLVGAGRPVVVTFSTPARCQTRYCGPTLDLILDSRAPFEDRVAFVHVEIYQHSTGPELVPTVTAWGLESEPWLYGIDAAGRVVDRLDGAFDRSEIQALAQRLVA